MRFEELDFELERVVSEVRGQKAKRVLVEMPDGLKPFAARLAQLIEERTSAVVFVSVEPCRGICDVGERLAKLLGVDVLIHFGHAEL